MPESLQTKSGANACNQEPFGSSMLTQLGPATPLPALMASLREDPLRLIWAPRVGLKKLPVYESRVLPKVQVLLAELEKVRHRFRFLVLCGPSGLGKTEYVKFLSGPEATYECDCSSTGTPDLKDYSRARHKVVLFDEAHPQLILQNKKLFQAHISPAVLGQTTTGCYSYKVWVWRRLLVVTTNSWDLSRLAHADAAWLTANACVVNVDQKLYVEPATSSSP